VLAVADDIFSFLHDAVDALILTTRGVHELPFGRAKGDRCQTEFLLVARAVHSYLASRSRHVVTATSLVLFFLVRQAPP